MKLTPYVQKLEKSKEFKNFNVKYPDSFMIAGFFILDFEGGKNIHQIDFYLPDERKVAAFTLDEGVNLQLMDMLNNKVPEKLDLKTNIDLDALKGILLDEMHNRGMSEQIKKIIAIIQSINGKRIWNLNCVLSGMEILKSHVDDDSQTVLKIEKQSLMDIMKQIPMNKLKGGTQAGADAGAVAAPGKRDLNKEMENLNKLEEEIEKEKAKLQSEMKKEPSKKTAAKTAKKSGRK